MAKNKKIEVKEGGYILELPDGKFGLTKHSDGTYQGKFMVYVYEDENCENEVKDEKGKHKKLLINVRAAKLYAYWE